MRWQMVCSGRFMPFGTERCCERATESLVIEKDANYVFMPKRRPAGQFAFQLVGRARNWRKHRNVPQSRGER